MSRLRPSPQCWRGSRGWTTRPSVLCLERLEAAYPRPRASGIWPLLPSLLEAVAAETWVSVSEHSNLLSGGLFQDQAGGPAGAFWLSK